MLNKILQHNTRSLQYGTEIQFQLFFPCSEKYIVEDLYIIRLLKKNAAFYPYREFISSRVVLSVVSSLDPPLPPNPPSNPQKSHQTTTTTTTKQTNNRKKPAKNPNPHTSRHDKSYYRLLLNTYLLQVFFFQDSWNTHRWKSRTADSYFLHICLNKHGTVHLKGRYTAVWWRKEVVSFYYEKRQKNPLRTKGEKNL